MEQSQPETDDSEAIIFVTDHDGREHALPALEGWRVMEVIRDWGIELKEEVDRLDDAFAVEETSRLCCQILVSPDTNGLRVRLAPGSKME